MKEEAMNRTLPESDWKYMCSIKDDLLTDLAREINLKSMDILSREPEHEINKYEQLCDHIRESDRVVAECFDDWRRSTLLIRLFALRRNELIGESVLENLSDDVQEKLKAIQEMDN